MNKWALILIAFVARVYCRSGRRSKEASRIRADLGCTKVQEFGGIIDWPYEVEQ